MVNKNFIVAIDGPVGSGKGTLSIELAKELDALYLYTGGMYRALALACLRNEVNLREEKQVLQVLMNTDIKLEMSTDGAGVFLGTEDVTGEISRPEVGNATPIIAAIPVVRREMVARQKEMIEGKRAIVEGRDIATDVAPNADLKVYLTADVNTRAKRRFEQFKEKGIEKTLEEVLRDTKERDRQDMERNASPLTIVEDAFVIDTTNDTVSDTIDKVKNKLRDKGLL